MTTSSISAIIAQHREPVFKTPDIQLYPMETAISTLLTSSTWPIDLPQDRQSHLSAGQSELMTLQSATAEGAPTNVTSYLIPFLIPPHFG